MIVKATYTSVWDGESVLNSSPCRYDTESKRCFDIDASSDLQGVENLDREYVELEDGTQLDEGDGVTFEY